MLKQGLFCLLMAGAATVCAQMETDGDWPTPAIDKHSPGPTFAGMMDIAHSDAGWFDDYLHDVMVDHNGRMWLAGQYGLAYSDDGGLSWQKSIAKYAIYSIFETKKHTLLASSNNSFVLRSEDNGKTWTHQQVFGKNGPTGRSSHGERYNDIFYTQVDDHLIVRTCQYSPILLLSKDEGKTWQKNEGLDAGVNAQSIFVVNESLVIMFTHDEMRVSRDKCKTWTKEHKGLPTPDDSMYEVIANGVVTGKGTIIGLISSQEKDVKNKDEKNLHAIYIFDPLKNQWHRDTTYPMFAWRQDELFNIGNNRLLLYDGDKKTWLVSYDEGRSWGCITCHYYDEGYGNDAGYPRRFSSWKNKTFVIHNTRLAQVNFPEKCNVIPPSGKNIIEDSLKEKLRVFPSQNAIAGDELSVHQQCTGNGDGFSIFHLHVPETGVLTSVNVYTKEEDETEDVLFYGLAHTLEKGDYEIWVHNRGLRGNYYLQCIVGVKDAVSNCFFEPE